MIILVDQDGVLANYNEALLAEFHARHPDVPRPPKEALSRFETEENYPKQYRQELMDIPLEKGFFRNLPPIDGAIEALHEMLDRGLDVRICTSPKRAYQYCAPEKFEWLTEHVGRNITDKMIMTRDKTLVHGSFLIDDKPRITGGASPTWEHILFDQPYNQACTDRRHLNWSNWKDVLGV